MIHVRIEMWPLGDQSEARHMGTIEIANDGTGTREEGNYKVRLSRMDSPTRAWKSLAIKGFNRVTRGPHDLLLLALLSGVGQRNKRLIDQLKEEYGGPGVQDGLAVDRDDARRLVWISQIWGSQQADYASHLLSTGGDGDLDDIRAYIDKQMAATSTF
jgi:hypothetical protein